MTPPIMMHARWAELLPYLYLRRGRNGVNGPRQRIEVQQDAPPWVFAIEVPCAHCGRPMNPVREDARGAWTFNVSCPLAVSVKCARMAEATAAASAVRAAMESRSSR